jgi:hypothetical protein
MFRALLCPLSEARDCDVDYHIGRVVLGLLYFEGKVHLGWSGVRVAGSSLQPGLHSRELLIMGIVMPETC